MVETGDDRVAVAAEAVGVGAISQEACRARRAEGRPQRRIPALKGPKWRLS